LDSFDKRQVADYEVDIELDRDVAINVIHQAHEFLEAAQEYLDKEQTYQVSTWLGSRLRGWRFSAGMVL
jgi:hypothetical protein